MCGYVESFRIDNVAISANDISENSISMSKPDGYNAVSSTVIYTNGSTDGVNCSYCSTYYVALSDKDTIINVRTRNMSDKDAIVKIEVKIIFLRDYTL